MHINLDKYGLFTLVTLNLSDRDGHFRYLKLF